MYGGEAPRLVLFPPVLGCRLTVGRLTLNQVVGVRIPAPQPLLAVSPPLNAFVQRISLLARMVVSVERDDTRHYVALRKALDGRTGDSGTVRRGQDQLGIGVHGGR